jgi:threonine dehydratase
LASSPEPLAPGATEIQQAAARLRGHVRRTPVIEVEGGDFGLPGVQLVFKLEYLQHTGSFKVRGALNKLLTLTPEQRTQGIVTASSGNHGAAVAYGLRLLGARGLIVVPEHASPAKVELIRRLGAEVRHYGDDALLSEEYARDYALQQGLVYISPYNDPQVIAGQGTIGVELAQQLDRVDAVFVAVGGGGLIAGIAGYLKALRPDITIVGCQPERSAVMAESVRAGRIVEIESGPTLSDATAGGIEAGAITFDLCRRLVDEYVLVSEEEIAAAIRTLIEAEHILVEGAAGVAVAAYQKRRAEFRDKNVALVLCGANISLQTLKTIL